MKKYEAGVDWNGNITISFSLCGVWLRCQIRLVYWAFFANGQKKKGVGQMIVIHRQHAKPTPVHTHLLLLQ